MQCQGHSVVADLYHLSEAIHSARSVLTISLTADGAKLNIQIVGGGTETDNAALDIVQVNSLSCPLMVS